ncbi:hypothetical protein [Chitinophaga sp. GbtcB8]|uniref:hypothetical protein n=1 Tax=Chitinophaga sp. GbtcB8 TaxID=2824753 RepID=UPI0034CDD0B8
MWLFRATGNETYLDILSSENNGGVHSMFSWDDKFFGVQLLVSKVSSLTYLTFTCKS